MNLIAIVSFSWRSGENDSVVWSEGSTIVNHNGSIVRASRLGFLVAIGLGRKVALKMSFLDWV